MGSVEVDTTVVKCDTKFEVHTRIFASTDSSLTGFVQQLDIGRPRSSKRDFSHVKIPGRIMGEKSR
jgi:hypothetical protein